MTIMKVRLFINNPCLIDCLSLLSAHQMPGNIHRSVVGLVSLVTICTNTYVKSVSLEFHFIPFVYWSATVGQVLIPTQPALPPRSIPISIFNYVLKFWNQGKGHISVLASVRGNKGQFYKDNVF